MASNSQAMRLGYLLSPHIAFQGYAVHTARWPAMLSPNGSSGTCIPDGVYHIPMPCLHGATIPPVRPVRETFILTRLTREGNNYGKGPFRQLHGTFTVGSLTRSPGTCVLFPDLLPQVLRHVHSFPTLRLL